MAIECVELRLVNVAVLFDLAVEALQRLEEQPLMRVIKRLAEVQVFQRFTATGTRCQTGKEQEPDP